MSFTEETSLFMDVLGSTGPVLLNLFRTQNREEKEVSALASGLRVQSASDDPSGLAIAETIETKVTGLQQGVQNVQDASNLLGVADATLATVQRILSRIHDLIIEAHSDFNSAGQLHSIQIEIDQLLREVNKISGDAKFNGITLFDGHFDTSPATQGSIEIINSEPNSDGTISSQDVANQAGPGGGPGSLILNQAFSSGTGFVPALIEFRVTGYNANDPSIGGGPSDTITVTAFSTDPTFGNGQETTQSQAFATDSGLDGGGYAGPDSAAINTPSGQNLFAFDFANLEQADVGTAMTFLTTPGKAAGTGTPLTVNSQGTEGGTVSISLIGLSTTNLNLSGITVLAPSLVDASNNPIGQSTSNEYAADDAEARVHDALEQISQARAQVGAQTVALAQDANDASTQIVNQIAAESAIRDLNIGQATTQFTKDQVLSQMGQSVLAQMQTNAKQLTALLIQAL